MYKRIKELQNKHDFAFNMALYQLLRIGSANAVNITDKEIENAKIPMFSDDLAKIYMRMLKELGEIAIEDCTAIYQFVEVEKPINTNGFKKK